MDTPEQLMLPLVHPDLNFNTPQENTSVPEGELTHVRQTDIAKEEEQFLWGQDFHTTPEVWE